MEAYLDNSATTRCMECVTEQMFRILREDYGNPSSLHKKGMDAEHYIKEAKAFFCRKSEGQRERDLFYFRGYGVQ